MFPISAFFLVFPANNSVLQPHDKYLQLTKRGKFERYMDESEGQQNSDMTLKNPNCFKG